jgi:hypothetical protein
MSHFNSITENYVLIQFIILFLIQYLFDSFHYLSIIFLHLIEENLWLDSFDLLTQIYCLYSPVYYDEMYSYNGN